MKAYAIFMLPLKDCVTASCGFHIWYVLATVVHSCCAAVGQSEVLRDDIW